MNNSDYSYRIVAWKWLFLYWTFVLNGRLTAWSTGRWVIAVNLCGKLSRSVEIGWSPPVAYGHCVACKRSDKKLRRTLSLEYSSLGWEVSRENVFKDKAFKALRVLQFNVLKFKLWTKTSCKKHALQPVMLSMPEFRWVGRSESLSLSLSGCHKQPKSRIIAKV